ncbi:hypothetical protein MYX64_10245 [Nitrospinae bacterium AH_259_B05_G02_I21]|nr:hypothetical protein [Nitrospinae bacterium AH_259_B05_G02_I21]
MGKPTFSTLYLHREANRLYLDPINVFPGEQVEELDLGGELGVSDTLRWIADYMVNLNNRELQIAYQDHVIFPRASPVPSGNHIGFDLPEENQWGSSFSVRFHGGDETKDWPRYSLGIIFHSEAAALYEALTQGIQFVDNLVSGHL